MRLKSSRLSWRIRTLSFWLRLGNLFTKNSKGANRKYVIKTLRYYLQDIFINVFDMTLHCKSTFCAFMFYTVLSSYSSMCTAFLTLSTCVLCVFSNIKRTGLYDFFVSIEDWNRIVRRQTRHCALPISSGHLSPNNTRNTPMGRPLLALCAGNSSVTGEFPSQRPMTRSFDVLYDLRLNKRMSKPLKRQWFETSTRSLWRHCNENIHSCCRFRWWCTTSGSL